MVEKLPALACVDPNRGPKCVAPEAFAMLVVRRAVSEKCGIEAKLSKRERRGHNGRLFVLGCQEGDDRSSIVVCSRAAHFMKVGVQQLVETISIAANFRMVKFDFKGFQVL